MASTAASPTLVPGARDSASGLHGEAVYRSELPRVYNFMRYMVLDNELAEDLTAPRSSGPCGSARYADKCKITSWQFSIARNVARDHFRSQRRQEPLADVEAETCGP